MFLSRSDIKSAEIQAVIIRTDGTVEPLGTIAYYHVNPLKRFAFWLKTKLKRG